jgi:hypothetical protein
VESGSLVPTEQAARDLFFSVFGPLFDFELATRTHRCVEHTLSCQSVAAHSLYSPCGCRPTVSVCACSPGSGGGVRSGRPRCLGCAPSVSTFWAPMSDENDIPHEHLHEHLHEPLNEHLGAGQGVVHAEELNGRATTTIAPMCAHALCVLASPSSSASPAVCSPSSPGCVTSPPFIYPAHRGGTVSTPIRIPSGGATACSAGNVYRSATTTLDQQGAERWHTPTRTGARGASSSPSASSAQCVWPTSPVAYLSNRRSGARSRSSSRLSPGDAHPSSCPASSCPSFTPVPAAASVESLVGAAAGVEHLQSAPPSFAETECSTHSAPSTSALGEDAPAAFPGSHAPGCGRGILWVLCI